LAANAKFSGLAAMSWGFVVRGTVLSVSLSPVHGFHKTPQDDIRLLAGLGVEGDAH
jgi:hypothetical protein